MRCWICFVYVFLGLSFKVFLSLNGLQQKWNAFLENTMAVLFRFITFTFDLLTYFLLSVICKKRNYHVKHLKLLTRFRTDITLSVWNICHTGTDVSLVKCFWWYWVRRDDCICRLISIMNWNSWIFVNYPCISLVWLILHDFGPFVFSGTTNSALELLQQRQF